MVRKQGGEEMKELLKIEINEKHEPIISGRELHERLEVKTRYNDWISRMLEYGFVESIDYLLLTQKRESNNPKNPIIEYTDHALKLDMAKEIAMLQRTEKGKEIRHYFIQVEKEYNSPEKIMARALHIANEQLEKLTLENKEQQELLKKQKPKVIFAEAVETSESSILIGELSKILKQKGINIGQNKLFEQLREEGYLMKQGSSRNMPTQRSMEMKLFEIKERALLQPNGSIKVTKTTKVTGKGQIYFINKYLGENKKTAI